MSSWKTKSSAKAQRQKIKLKQIINEEGEGMEKRVMKEAYAKKGHFH